MVSEALKDAFYVSMDTMLPTDIYQGCENGDINKVKAWLDHGGQINAEHPNGETLLIVAYYLRSVKDYCSNHNFSKTAWRTPIFGPRPARPTESSS